MKPCLTVKSHKESIESSKTSSKSSRRKSPIKFKSVEVREYPRIVGDNPSCSGGAPMSIDWCHYPQQYYDINDFEGGHPGRRKRSEMCMPSEVRHKMLVNDWGCSMKSIMEASKERKDIAELRKKSASQSKLSFKTEERMELIKNTFLKNKRKSISLVKSDSLTCDSKLKSSSSDSLDNTMSSSASSLLLVKL